MDQQLGDFDDILAPTSLLDVVMTLRTVLCVRSKPLASTRVFLGALVPNLNELAQQRSMIAVITAAKAKRVTLPASNGWYDFVQHRFATPSSAKYGLRTFSVWTEAKLRGGLNVRLLK